MGGWPAIAAGLRGDAVNGARRPSRGGVDGRQGGQTGRLEWELVRR